MTHSIPMHAPILQTNKQPAPITAQPVFMQRLPLLLALCALLGAPLAQAAIDLSPSSIISNGSFITDKVNNKDWYKFNNAESTIGLSFNESVAKFSALGWSIAGLADVRGLQSQFGWAADTFDFGNDNLDLTQAMGKYLGFTSVDKFSPTSSPNQMTTSYKIQAMTWNGFCAFGSDTCDQNITLSETRTFYDQIDAGSFNKLGDYVDGESSSQLREASDPRVGTWLMRDSLPDLGCSGASSSPCTPPVTPVPEPSTYALMLAGLGFIGFVGRRRSERRAQSI